MSVTYLFMISERCHPENDNIFLKISAGRGITLYGRDRVVSLIVRDVHLVLAFSFVTKMLRYMFKKVS